MGDVTIGKQKRICLIIISSLLLFVFCLSSQAKSNENQATSRPSPTESAEDLPFPRVAAASGLYVNGWPAFSISYPKHWLEKKREPVMVFRAEDPEGFPQLRIVVLPMPFPVGFSILIHNTILTSVGGTNIKVLYDEKSTLEDGTPAQEAELEWTDNSGKKLNNLFLTAKTEDKWIYISLSDNKGRISKEVKDIAYSLKIKPEEKRHISYQYKVPEQTDDGWHTTHIDDVNLDEKPLTELIGKILNGTYPNVHSVLIIKNGKLVLEEYFPGEDIIRGYVDFNRDELHHIMSVTKGVTSTSIGIAIDKGMIQGTDEDLVSFFSEYKKELSTDDKAKITLRHLLSMTSGLEWDQDTFAGIIYYQDPRNPSWSMPGPAGGNIISYTLMRPMKDQPGSAFMYNGGLYVLLATILEKRSGLKLDEFAQQYLFEPLGISRYEWGYFDTPAGKMINAGGGLFLRPRDMAKLGYLFLKKGIWKGKQIVSAEWIEEATKEHINTYPGSSVGYGYGWWTDKFKIDRNPIEAYQSIGWGGQYVLVFPSLDMVVVFTAGNYSLNFLLFYMMMYSMVNNYIFPATTSPQ